MLLWEAMWLKPSKTKQTLNLEAAILSVGKLLRSEGPILQMHTNRIWPHTTDMQKHHLLQFLQTLKSNTVFSST